MGAIIVPERKIIVPHWYQGLGRDFIVDNPRCALHAGMGLGKTWMTTSALELLALAGSNYFPALVLGPKRVAQVVWTNEAAKWTCFEGLKVVSLAGITKQGAIAILKGPKADIYTINYENILWLCEIFPPERWPFRIVIADESTHLKSFRLAAGAGGQRANALSFIARHTGRWVNLTGTPSPNGLIDLWGQYWFLDFGQRLLRTYTDFESKWFEVNHYSRERALRAGAADEIMERTKDLTMSLKTEDCLPVLEPQRITIEVELPKKARQLYSEMEDDFFINEFGEFGIEAKSAAAKSGKLLQMASGFIYDTENNQAIHDIHDAKIEALKDLVKDLGEPLMVAYYWNPADIEKIMRAFKQAEMLNTEKQRLRWNDGKIEIGLLHPASGGHGLDFADGGRNIVFFSQTWNYEYRAQIIERLGPARQLQAGYNRVVRIFDILAGDTIDYAAYARNDGKKSVNEALMDYQRRY